MPGRVSGPVPVPIVAAIEAIRFFRAKGFRFSFAWQDVWQEEHARAFTVAKAMTRDLLETIRAAVDRAIAEGETLETFRKDLRPKLEAAGWWGRKTMIDPLTAQAKTAQLGSPRRLKTIFNVNIRTSYQAGKWERFERQKTAFPYLEYVTAGDLKVRDEHAAWNGTILLISDSWWDTHYGPCDYECRCSARAYSERMLERRGKVVTAEPVVFPPEKYLNKRTGEVSEIERGIGPGWSYNVGKAALAGQAPPPLSGTAGAADIASSIAPDLAAFFDVFGLGAGEATKGKVFIDRGGWPLAICLAWFQLGGRLVLPAPARRRWLAAAARTLREPDEIRWVWVKAADGAAMLMRRYVSHQCVVDVGRAGWRFVGAGEVEDPRLLRRGTIAWSAERAAIASFDPRQPRDEGGRWRGTGLSSPITTLSEPLTGDEERALGFYSAEGSTPINRALRDLDDGEGDLDPDELDELVSNLDSAIAKGSLTHDTRLYRGVDDLGHLDSVSLSRGAVFADHGFTSTSKSWIAADRFAQKPAGTGVLFIIHAKAGTKALDITRDSSVGTGEYEVLFPRSSLWRVRSFDPDGTLIEIESAR